MSFDYKKWITRTELLYMNLLKEYDDVVSGYFEDGIAKKQKVIRILQKELLKQGGTIPEELSEQLVDLESELISESQRLKRKMMLFIIGDGKSGKSTLINALLGLGREVAEIDDLPNTRYIHVYTNEIEAGKVRIRYYNAENEICEEVISQSQCLERIRAEREEIKTADRECKKRIRELSKGKSPEEKDEIEKAIYQEYGKSGNIIELFWGIENSSLLESCNLIDTPGFNQNIDSKYLEKKRNIESLKSHYNQADGILWVLDSQTINGNNTKKLYDQLCETYEDSQADMQKNLFYVVNKMDIITTPEDKRRLIQEAQNIYQNQAASIVFLSAKMAFEGQCENDSKRIAQSGLKNLMERINQTFLQRQAGWNLSRIRKNYSRTKKNTEWQIRKTHQRLEVYHDRYLAYRRELLQEKKKQQEYIENMIGETASMLWEEGYQRIRDRIDVLNTGTDEERKNQIIYRLFCIDECYEVLESSYHSCLAMVKAIYDKLDVKLCLSEYEHYKNYDYSGIALPQIHDLENFSVENVFSYEKEGIGEILSLFGGMGQKIMFWANKGKITETLTEGFQNWIHEMGMGLKQKLQEYEKVRWQRSCEILTKSCEKIIGNIEETDTVLRIMKKCGQIFGEAEKMDITFMEMLMREDEK